MTQAITAFTTFLPPITEIRKGSVTDAQFAGDVRLGEVAAAGLTIGVGAMVSGLTGSSVPTVVAFLTAAGLILLYESTLQANRPMEGSGNVVAEA